MGLWQAINLIAKYFPIVVELVQRLEASGEELILEARIDKKKGKIEDIFKREGDAESARSLNDVFRK